MRGRGSKMPAKIPNDLRMHAEQTVRSDGPGTVREPAHSFPNRGDHISHQLKRFCLFVLTTPQVGDRWVLSPGAALWKSGATSGGPVPCTRARGWPVRPLPK